MGTPASTNSSPPSSRPRPPSTSSCPSGRRGIASVVPPRSSALSRTPLNRRSSRVDIPWRRATSSRLSPIRKTWLPARSAGPVTLARASRQRPAVPAGTQTVSLPVPPACGGTRSRSKRRVQPAQHLDAGARGPGHGRQGDARGQLHRIEARALDRADRSPAPAGSRRSAPARTRAPGTAARPRRSPAPRAPARWGAWDLRRRTVGPWPRARPAEQRQHALGPRRPARDRPTKRATASVARSGSRRPSFQYPTASPSARARSASQHPQPGAAIGRHGRGIEPAAGQRHVHQPARGTRRGPAPRPPAAPADPVDPAAPPPPPVPRGRPSGSRRTPAPRGPAAPAGRGSPARAPSPGCWHRGSRSAPSPGRPPPAPPAIACARNGGAPPARPARPRPPARAREPPAAR